MTVDERYWQQHAFKVGDRVRVMSAPSWGHCRTPDYIRGKVGRIHTLYGYYRNPESLAYGGTGLPVQPLYRVEFEQKELWPSYERTSLDKLWADVYHHWLERIATPDQGFGYGY